MNFKNICVLGLGYIGLPTASTFATHGVRVVGVDVNAQVVATLQNGGLHIHEPGLRTLVQAALKSGNLSVSEQPEEADAFIITVPTPFKENKKADLAYVISASEAIVPHLRAGNLVILESTSPPRTTIEVVAPILEKSGLKAAEDFHLVYSPERVLPGQILRELIDNARVVGGIDDASAQAARELYTIFVRGEIFITDATTAEMVKLMENTYRDVNIAIANEFSRLGAHFGVDIWEAINLANRHPRVEILRPGPGVGGHCISVDPWFLVEAAPDIAHLIKTARQVNDQQPQVVVDMLHQALGGLDGKRIAVLGLAFKPDVDDLRESPAVDVAYRMIEMGAEVTAYEPYKVDADYHGINMAPNLDEAIKKADGLVLLVAHAPLRSLVPEDIAAKTETRVALDAVNGWDANAWKAAGFSLFRLGVGTDRSPRTTND